MKKRTLMALICLLGGLFYLLIGYVIFDYLLGSYTEAHTTQLIGFKKSDSEMSLLGMYASCVAYAALICFVQSLKSPQSYLAAFSQSALIGLLVALMTDCFWYSTSHFYTDFSAVIIDCIGAIFSVGALGVFIHATKHLLKPANR
jgi:hypothetical protein